MTNDHERDDSECDFSFDPVTQGSDGDALPCWQVLTYGTGIGLFALTRLLNWLWRPAPVVAGDTPMYLPGADQGRFDLVDFWGNRSRPGVATFLFALFENPERIVLAQHIASLLMWGLLLILVAKCAPFSSPFRAVSFLCIAGVASLPAVTLWNDVLLSESFSLTWMAALSCLGVIIWARHPDLTVKATFALGACTGLATVLVGPVRPLVLGVTVVLGVCLAVVLVRQGLQTHRQRSNDRLSNYTKIAPSLAGLVLVVISGIYVVGVDSKANYSWGQEFAGLEDFNGRAIQQLTVVSDSSQWSYDAYWHYIRSVGDECLERGFEAGQYWPLTAMQCPDGIRVLAETFQRHYIIDYLRFLPKHFDESVRDYRIGLSYISNPPGYGVDMLPHWSRGLLLTPTPNGSLSPFVYPALVLALASAVGIFALLDRSRRRNGGETLSDRRISTVMPPLAMFFVSLAAVVVTVIVSPGDPRVAVVHATSTRVWTVLAVAAMLAQLLERTRIRERLAAFTLLREVDDRDG